MSIQRIATPDRSSVTPAAMSRAADPHAELVNATKRFGSVVALDNVSLQARRGEVVAVLGPNGAGKTTAISCMLGLLKTTQGTARLFGGSPHDAPARMRTGTMLQISGVPDTLSVREHLTSFRTYYPAPLTVKQAIDLAGLTDVADRMYGKLSGGQKQRLHFALAMIGNPDLLFLDEPTTGLDVTSRREFWAQIATSSVATVPSFSPRTTSKRPTRSPTAWSSSTRAASWWRALRRR